MTGGDESSVRMRCAQLAPVIGDLAGNAERIEREIARAVAEGVELLVLPELATSGYALSTEEARAAARRPDDAMFSRWAGMLGERLTVVLGFCEAGEEPGEEVATVYNSALILTPGTAPVAYRKLHLWDTEKLVFTPGSAPAPVVETPFGGLGVCICYDLEFPEMPRSLALRGADVIAVPTNWPLLAHPAGEHAPEVVQAMAAARASGVAIACCDRAGEERGIAWTEGTCIVGTDGWIAAEAGSGGGPARADATIPLPAERRSISTRNHLFADRAPRHYDPRLTA
ncbi:carbon-nitrogen hydrolase [Leucobacter allii]|uniref:Carbon-nitrogen hydrolase n=1 Tax=Leucobacter allii TaxID=2932247 RepID=A0ABY4FMZ8_9MICO|nr:nitrilase-related carbon-nitrogen hydrolase [Leucobacter allii]UOQ57621.1 carbon-nitrogen hydrolase [Leucobacter allii]